MQATANLARWYEASCSFSNSFYRHFSFCRHIISWRAASRYGGGTCCGARSGRREKEGQSSQPMFTLPPRQPPSPLARPRRTYSAQSGDGTGAVKSVRRGRGVEFDQARFQEENSRPSRGWVAYISRPNHNLCPRILARNDGVTQQLPVRPAPHRGQPAGRRGGWHLDSWAALRLADASRASLRRARLAAHSERSWARICSQTSTLTESTNSDISACSSAVTAPAGAAGGAASGASGGARLAAGSSSAGFRRTRLSRWCSG